LPGAPAGVRGVVNVHGAVLPVFDLRLQLGRPERRVRLTDYLLIANTSRRTVALLVDSVEGVIDGEEICPTRAGEIGVEAAVEILKFEGELVLVHDLDRFLSEEELEALQLALAERI
jgi:purine-binding chemotaxis protein CheW